MLQSATLNDEQDASAVVKGSQPTSTIGPVRQEPASGAVDERAKPVAGNRGRSTLGSVPKADAEHTTTSRNGTFAARVRGALSASRGVRDPSE